MTKVNLFLCVRVRCCRSVLTFWSKLWIRSWCQISGWVIEFCSQDICLFLTVSKIRNSHNINPHSFTHYLFLLLFSVSRGSVRPTNGPRTSLLLESSPLAESGPTTPPRRNWTQTLSTSSPQGPAGPSFTAWRMRCLVREDNLFTRKEAVF